MKLKEYIDKKGLKYGAYAKQLGISPRTLWKAMNGHDILLSIAVKIEIESKGKVKCIDLYHPNDNESE